MGKLECIYSVPYYWTFMLFFKCLHYNDWCHECRCGQWDGDLEAVNSILLGTPFPRACWLRSGVIVWAWLFRTLRRTGCEVLGKSLSFSGASISLFAQWKRLDLVKFLGFPEQCKQCHLWALSLLSFLVAFSALPCPRPRHSLLPSPGSLFPFFTSLLLPTCFLVHFFLALLLGQTASEPLAIFELACWPDASIPC